MLHATSLTAPDPDFGGTVRVIEIDRPASGSDDDETAQSIGLMQVLSARDTIAGSVQQAAAEAVQGLSPEAGFRDIADAIFWWIKSNVRYTHEDELQTPFTDVAGIVDQTLIPPGALLAMPQPMGDCPHFSMLCASMLRIYNIPSAFKTIAADPKHPQVFSHVYNIAQIAPGVFYALDTSNGPAPGAEYGRATKAKIWPNHQDTDPETMLKDSDSRRQRISRASRLQGLADLDTSSPDSFIDSVLQSSQSQAGYNIYADAGISPSYTGSQLSTSAPSSVASSTSTSGGFAKLFSTIANDATAIAAPIIRQDNIKAPYYITGANGAQILYDPSTGKTVNAGAGTVGAALSGSNLQYLLVAIVGIAAVSLATGSHRGGR